MLSSGIPLNARIASAESTAIVEMSWGFDVSRPSVNLPLGGTPVSDNVILRDGAIELRPTLSLFTGNPHPQGNVPALGLYELETVDGFNQHVESGTTRHAVFGQGSAPNEWSLLSYLPGNGVDDPPSLINADSWDYAQVYSAAANENLVYMATSSYQTLYAHVAGTGVFSTMTGAPQARFVAAYDNYIVAANLREGAANLVQRVQWNDRGSASSWTGGLSGFQDLLDMRGEITRIIPYETGVFVFSDEEVWRGQPLSTGVDVWTFARYDSSRGCPYSWTVTNTPLGIMFLGKDYQVYLLPKGGGPSQPIGPKVQRRIRTTIDYPERAWSVYDNTYQQYKLNYAIAGGSGFPQRGVWLDIPTGAWMPQSYDSAGGGLSLSRGIEGQLRSSATTWGGLFAAGPTWATVTGTWDDYAGRDQGRAIIAGSSNGTIYYDSSTGTSDNGTAVPQVWQSGALLGGDPSQQKTVTKLLTDYQATTASKITVQYTQDVGASFHSSSVSLPAISSMSQADSYPYFGARYPAFEVTAEGVRHRLFRFWLQFTRGGR